MLFSVSSNISTYLPFINNRQYAFSINVYSGDRLELSIVDKAAWCSYTIVFAKSTGASKYKIGFFSSDKTFVPTGTTIWNIN